MIAIDAAGLSLWAASSKAQDPAESLSQAPPVTPQPGSRQAPDQQPSSTEQSSFRPESPQVTPQANGQFEQGAGLVQIPGPEPSTSAPSPAPSAPSATPQPQAAPALAAPPAPAPAPSSVTVVPKDSIMLTEEAAKKLLDEEEERRKNRKRKKGRIRELEEVNAGKCQQTSCECKPPHCMNSV